MQLSRLQKGRSFRNSKRMDKASKQAKRALEAIALSNERLIDLTVKLRFRSEVTEVLHDLDVRRYESGSTVEGYVDAQLQNGKGICWWLEINCDEDKWLFESRVTVSNLRVDEGSEDLIRFEDKTAETLDEFVTSLEKATSELVESANSIDLNTCERIASPD